MRGRIKRQMDNESPVTGMKVVKIVVMMKMEMVKVKVTVKGF